MRLQTAKRFPPVYSPTKMTHQKETTSHPCSPLPIRMREHVCSDGDLNVERALRITRASSFEIPVNLVFQVCVACRLRVGSTPKIEESESFKNQFFKVKNRFFFTMAKNGEQESVLDSQDSESIQPH